MRRSLLGLERQRALLLGITVIILAVSLVPLTAGAAGTLDQSFVPTVSNVLGEFDIFGGDQRQMTGQTFTAGITGTLTQVDVYLGRNTQNAPGTAPLRVQIQTLTSGGAPTGTVLGAVSVAASAVPLDPNPGWVSVPISAPSVAGSRYAIVLSTDDPRTNYGVYDSRQESPLYPGGRLWYFVPSAGGQWETNVALPNDSFFRTYVAPVPTTIDACKDGGWQRFTNPAFKNQGECVAYVEHHR